ncbi:MAG: hypothetical protein OEZ36_05075, partial [Spirochaetota bacterium]|nr:hypothetical protein [Spirochaetota bacterium]
MTVRKDIITFIIWFLWLIGLAVLLDGVLHKVQLPQLGRYAGMFGTGLIVLSFLYYLRKKKVIKSGSLKGYLRFHEWGAWLGSLLILVHSGIHF